MSFDFKALLNPNRDTVLEERDELYRQIGAEFSDRVSSPEFQKVITYCLLQRISPATMAQLIRQYLAQGKLPWNITP